MKKLLFAGLILWGLTSCSMMTMTTTPTQTAPLYSWNDYTESSYQYYKKQTPEATERLMKTYGAMIKKQNGSRKALAPGIYAEYGYFLIQHGKKDEGVAMLKKEKEIYPESSIFMDKLIKKFEQ
ncbi:MAG: DUF4810 domain-containing protein [Tannerellaceae bacterium]